MESRPPGRARLGAVGRPIRLRLAHRDTRALRSDGFADQPYFAAMPRLILLEMGCHLVDTARYLLGEVEPSRRPSAVSVRATWARTWRPFPHVSRAAPSACST